MVAGAELSFIGGDDARRFRAKRRFLYRFTIAVFTLVVLGAVVDATGHVDLYGVDTSHVSASGGGYDLDVRYGAVTRPALATPFDITVTRRGGFEGPVTLAVSREYLLLWDVNGVLPTPSSETVLGDWVVWELDAPVAGDRLQVSYEARIEPAAQTGADGTVAVLVDDQPVVTVAFRTEVRP